MHRELVPVTPSVVAWAIRESGFTIPKLATMLSLPEGVIEGWTRGQPPELSVFRKFAAAVERPLAAFLLPKPPTTALPRVKFRHARSTAGRDLNPEERRRIREASRLQGVISWLARELKITRPDVPWFTTKDNPEVVARVIRARAGISLEAQLSWASPTEALRTWREAVEDNGVTVFMVSMGEESCRGFSIWDDRAPLICVNTAWLPEARVFTLLHEYAHLVTRTNSVCVEDGPLGSSVGGDSTERWCERVAAAVAIPSESLDRIIAELPRRTSGSKAGLDVVTRIANRLRVSRRAAALRLIESGRASWSLFKAFPPHVDRHSSGGGGRGRTRETIRRQQYGQRTFRMFRAALERDVLGAADVVDYLGVSPDALSAVGASAGDE